MDSATYPLPPVKVLTVRQPYAEAIIEGIKTWECRPFPPHGDMCPPGARGLPGLRLDAGDRVLLHAAAAPLGPQWDGGDGMIPRGGRHDGHWNIHRDTPDGPVMVPTGGMYWEAIPLHFGQIIGSFTVPKVVPIVGADRGTGEVVQDDGERLWHWPRTCVIDDPDITIQKPWGIWTPGWSAWEIADVERIGAGCPLCGMKPGDALVREEFDPDDPDGVLTPCRVCHGKGTSGPVEAKGKLGIWAL